MSRVILTAAGSGSGKTLITCGILKAMSNKGLSVKAFKCGPDYIDPMFHTKVIGVPSENLDTFFSNQEHLQMLLERSAIYDIAVIEGAMGIYDGLGGVSKEGSVYDLAYQTKTPIVLIMDAYGMGRTLISVVKGILADDEHRLIQGVILNRVSEHFYGTIAPVLKSETGIEVLGYIPKLANIELDSRHLGLKLPSEIAGLEEQVERMGTQVGSTVDTDALLTIAGRTKTIEEKQPEVAVSTAKQSKREVSIEKQPEVVTSANRILAREGHDVRRPRLAVAKDEVFCFYYEENLRLLEEAGAELVYFSPLHDEKIPDNVSGLLLGGGYPELRLADLEANVSMRQSIREALDRDMPSLAECGGFMYLHETIEGDDGKSYEMVGSIPARCYNTGRLCRFGYVKLQIMDYIVKGHEFHYYDSSANGTDAVAVKASNGKQWEFGYVGGGKIWGYPHLYYASCSRLPIDFVAAMKRYQDINA